VRAWASISASASRACYHQEQTYQAICEKHGNDSEPHNAAKVIFGELYGTYPGYRYMYALRNVMIHDAMDAIALEATAALDQNRQTIGNVGPQTRP
jgi:hypothetical protein